MSNFGDFQAAIIPARFDAGDTAAVKQQINVRHGWIWAQEDWPFKHTIGSTFTPALTVDLDVAFSLLALRPERIYDDQGAELEYVELADLRRQVLASPTTARPSKWAWLGRTLYFDATPDIAYTFTMDYAARLYHRIADGTRAAGAMTLATDRPAWARVWEDDLWLAAGAAAALMKLRNDPTYPPLEDEFQGGYLALANELIPDRPEDTLQYGMQAF